MYATYGTFVKSLLSTPSFVLLVNKRQHEREICITVSSSHAKACKLYVSFILLISLR